MPKKDKALYILKYLWSNTDDEHFTTIAEIIDFLAKEGIMVERHTVASYIEQLTNFGFDIICLKSSPNKYFIGQRSFELPELKLLVDAVESSHFISTTKSHNLVRKLCGLTSIHQANELNRHLYVEGRVKSECKALYYTVDLIHKAIKECKRIVFKYVEYTPEKKKVYKHNGCVYEFSPYAMLWHNDRYYVLGYSEQHGKIVKFRVDRIEKAEMTDFTAEKKPKYFNPIIYHKNIIAMYDGELKTVKLKCTSDMMNVIIDRFGKDVYTEVCNDGFTAEVQVSVSPTFFGWIFGFDGKIKISSPKDVLNDYKNSLNKAFCDC